MTKYALKLLAFAGMCCGAHAQGLGQLGFDLEAKLEASRAALRHSVVKLRDIRAASCRMGNSQDCELAMLTDVELTLLDIETKYARASRSAVGEKFGKVKDAADEARSKVSDLIDAIK